MDLGWCDLCLNVRDLEKSRAFYATLGLRVLAGKAADGYLIMGHENLRLGLYQGHLKENLINFRGGDVMAIARQLAAAGLTFEQGPLVESDGSASATLRDPDGHAIYFNTFPGETKPT